MTIKGRTQEAKPPWPILAPSPISHVIWASVYSSSRLTVLICKVGQHSILPKTSEADEMRQAKTCKALNTAQHSEGGRYTRVNHDRYRSRTDRCALGIRLRAWLHKYVPNEQISCKPVCGSHSFLLFFKLYQQLLKRA